MTEESSDETGPSPDPEGAAPNPDEIPGLILELDEVFAGLGHPRRQAVGAAFMSLLLRATSS